MPTSPLPEHVDALHREVQRKFGRNLLRLQEYERLIKDIVADHEVAGYSSELLGIRAAQYDSVATDTLGQVMKKLTDNFIVPASNATSSSNDDVSPDNLAQPWISMTHRIAFADENFKRVTQRLENVVDLRNELVHHFLEKHDICSEPGCLAADAYLDECFKLIDSSYEEMEQWAQHSSESKAIMANWLKSPEATDFFVHGILPGKAGVNWAASTIVNLLQDAESALSREGWTQLSKAIVYIREREPEHNPSKYGCSSWRHVLHESDLFDVRKVRTEGLPTETLYRSSPISENVGN